MNWDDQLPRRGQMRALIPVALALALFWVVVITAVWVSLSALHRHTVHVGPNGPAIACLRDGQVVTGKACPL